MLQAATPAGLTNSPRTGQDSTEQQQHHAATRPRHALHPPVPGRYGADPKLLPDSNLLTNTHTPTAECKSLSCQSLLTNTRTKPNTENPVDCLLCIESPASLYTGAH